MVHRLRRLNADITPCFLALALFLHGTSFLARLRRFRPGFHLLPTAIVLLLYGTSFLISTPAQPPAQVIQELKFPPPTATLTLEAYTRRVARNLGVDEALALAVLIQESDPVNPLKTGKGDSRGPLQIKPIALQDVGLSPDEQSLPILVHGGILYLKTMITRFHTLSAALAAYNMGPERLEQRHYRPYTSTQHYVRQVLARVKAIRSGTFPPHPILRYRFSVSEPHLL